MDEIQPLASCALCAFPGLLCWVEVFAASAATILVLLGLLAFVAAGGSVSHSLALRLRGVIIGLIRGLQMAFRW